MENKLVFSGAKLKNIRRSQCLTVEELAIRIDTSSSHLRKIESGKQKLTISMAKRIAIELDIYIDELL